MPRGERALLSRLSGRLYLRMCPLCTAGLVSGPERVPVRVRDVRYYERLEGLARVGEVLLEFTNGDTERDAQRPACRRPQELTVVLCDVLPWFLDRHRSHLLHRVELVVVLGDDGSVGGGPDLLEGPHLRLRRLRLLLLPRLLLRCGLLGDVAPDVAPHDDLDVELLPTDEVRDDVLDGGGVRSGGHVHQLLNRHRLASTVPEVLDDLRRTVDALRRLLARLRPLRRIADGELCHDQLPFFFLPLVFDPLGALPTADWLNGGSGLPFTNSVKLAPGLNLTRLVGGTRTGSPVCGFRASRAPR